MSRITVIFFSVLLTSMVIAACLAGTIYLSWINAEVQERDKLFAISKEVIQRARLNFEQAYLTLNALENAVSPCSPENIESFHMLLFNKSNINDIEYLENNVIKCSSSGVGKDTLFPPTEFEMANGVKIVYNLPLEFTQGNNFVAFKQNNYSVLVYSDRFTDIITDPYIKVAILTDDGHLLSSLNSPDPDMLRQAIKNTKLKATKNELIAITKIPDMYVIVSESRSYVLKKWRTELIHFLPFGLMIAAIATGAIIYFSRRRLSPVGELKIAIARREFLVYYQPLIDFKTGECNGAEALIRWRRPDGSMIRPDIFIPLAEDSGLIWPITEQVVETVIADLKDYFVANRKLHVAINLAVEDFTSGRVLKKLEETVMHTRIDRGQIWLEITERGFMDMQSCKERISDASQLGYTIVVDDFGTGFSSLAYLKELPLDVLKIDKSFIDSVATDSVTSNVTVHIIGLAKSLNLKIVAEGVETQEQADYLKARKVDYAQGWLYAKAMPINEFIEFYKKTSKQSEKQTKTEEK